MNSKNCVFVSLSLNLAHRAAIFRFSHNYFQRDLHTTESCERTINVEAMTTKDPSTVHNSAMAFVVTRTPNTLEAEISCAFSHSLNMVCELPNFSAMTGSSLASFKTSRVALRNARFIFVRITTTEHAQNRGYDVSTSHGETNQTYNQKEGGNDVRAVAKP